MKTSELTGALLDSWVVRALMEPFKGRALNDQTKADIVQAFGPGADVPFQPSTNWAHGGPIIDQGLISLVYRPVDEPDAPGVWEAFGRYDSEIISAESALVAAMRAYVASVFGDEVLDDPTVKADRKRNG